ncbi:hydrogenase maturation protease [Lacrimispora saccharolytica]|uniref:Hydrogenase maturation protease n=1 Tax=Lacrimispora saccharolytica (strain ATCC 35040 / DSM 2544 / NRCC 2533 / WM1) TaxID=610130 RepID=D9R2A7_LACSW|nr:hydrogenase maturation protease [Lacrimispora saccharolytica]ADL04757.1 hydrogenase maturation protease [[Clostridium] saccharolyticum WM1]QRV21023.1 hydrogenase maturation protease [Lacrimispora saccharolytica]
MVKLVAIGNRFMKDDAIAIKAAEMLEDRLTQQDVHVIIGETDFQHCFYLLDEDDFILILDALSPREEPGKVHLFSLKDVISQPSLFSMQHDMSMVELMKLYGVQFQGYLIGIEISEIGIGYELSAVLNHKLPQICREIENVIQKILWEETIHA